MFAFKSYPHCLVLCDVSCYVAFVCALFVCIYMRVAVIVCVCIFLSASSQSRDAICSVELSRIMDYPCSKVKDSPSAKEVSTPYVPLLLFAQG